MNIEGQTLSPKDVGARVTYIPAHADGDPEHKDCEPGIISSWNEHFVFVNYGKGAAQTTRSEDLVWA